MRLRRRADPSADGAARRRGEPLRIVLVSLAAIPIAIGVWLECAVDSTAVSTDRSAGFNVYVALCGNTTELSHARNGGMRVLFQSDTAWSPAFPADGVSAGYMIGDEWDMTHPPSDCLGAWVSQLAMFPGDGRMRYANFGKGVAYWNSNSQAACWVNSVDVPSADVYWFSDNNSCGPGEAGGEPCGSGQLETGLVVRGEHCPFGDGGWPCITGAEMRAAVWHSFIAGAGGVVYFNHSFKANAANGCDDSFHAIRECAPVGAAVTNTNAEVQSLASALNGPTLTGGMQATGNVKAMGKWDGSTFYVFAGATPEAGSAQFAIPCVGNASATVVGEGRSIPVSAGSFSDNFADANAVHIYRIDGGSTCGL